MPRPLSRAQKIHHAYDKVAVEAQNLLNTYPPTTQFQRRSVELWNALDELREVLNGEEERSGS